jgi:hypothetical protein
MKDCCCTGGGGGGPGLPGQVTFTARNFIVFKQGSPPKSSLLAATVHLALPRHRFCTTESDLGASQLGSWENCVLQVPVGVPKEAKSMA